MFQFNTFSIYDIYVILYELYDAYIRRHTCFGIYVISHIYAEIYDFFYMLHICCSVWVQSFPLYRLTTRAWIMTVARLALNVKVVSQSAIGATSSKDNSSGPDKMIVVRPQTKAGGR